MDKIQITFFDLAVSHLNHIMQKESEDFPVYQIIWHTSLGLAKGRTVCYDPKKILVKGSLEAMISIAISSCFTDINGDIYKDKVDKPYQAMKLLKEAVNNIDNNISSSCYDCSVIWDFELLGSTIKLPFADRSAVDVFNPVSLLVKS